MARSRDVLVLRYRPLQSSGIARERGLDRHIAPLDRRVLFARLRRLRRRARYVQDRREDSGAAWPISLDERQHLSADLERTPGIGAHRRAVLQLLRRPSAE